MTDTITRVEDMGVVELLRRREELLLQIEELTKQANYSNAMQMARWHT